MNKLSPASVVLQIHSSMCNVHRPGIEICLLPGIMSFINYFSYDGKQKKSNKLCWCNSACTSQCIFFLMSKAMFNMQWWSRFSLI